MKKKIKTQYKKKWLVLSSFLVFLFAIIFVYSSADDSHKEVTTEQTERLINKRAKYIFQLIKCAVCHGETIDESHTTFATNLKIVILKQLHENKSDEEILYYVKTRFGNEVILKTPFEGATYLLWLLPAALFFILIYITIIRRFTSKNRLK